MIRQRRSRVDDRHRVSQVEITRLNPETRHRARPAGSVGQAGTAVSAGGHTNSNHSSTTRVSSSTAMPTEAR